MKDFVERAGIACDFEETRVFDVCLHEAGREKVEADLKEKRRQASELTEIWQTGAAFLPSGALQVY